MLKQHTFRQRSTIFFEGDRGASMYLIHSGEVLMVRSGVSGQQVRLVRLRRGDFFGETTLIEMQPRPATAQAETDVTLFELTNMDLYRLYQADVKAYVLVLQNLNRELCRRLRAADGRVTTLAAESDDREVTQIAYMKPMR
jgi:CRP-like cAMP-binding protein